MKSQLTLLVVLMSALAAFVAKLRIWAERCIPVGYEDDSGFHTGVEQ
jgi:hypothetical protein